MIIRSNFSLRPFTLVEHEGFQYVVVIQNGYQIGALALTAQGRYVKVNGAVVQFLNTQKVLNALRGEARHRLRHRPAVAQATTVTVKRRRTGAAPAPRT